MGLTGCGKFLKYTMFLFNAVILIAGCGLLGFGVYSRTSENRLSSLTNLLGTFIYSTLTWALIISGGVVILLAFLGCCGAIKEVKCMLGSFFALLFLMLLGMIVGGILAFVFRDWIEDTAIEKLSESLKTKYGADKDITTSVDTIQTLFECCGVVGGANSTTSWAYYKLNSDWFNNQTDETMREYVPKSCCRNTMGPNRTKCVRGSDGMPPRVGPPIEESFATNDLLFTDGCYTAGMDVLQENANICIGVASGVAVLMILGMIFAVCLCRRIKDEFIFD